MVSPKSKAKRIESRAKSGKLTGTKSPTYFKCPQCLGYFKLAQRANHACVKPTEELLIKVLDEDARAAWSELRSFAVGLGEQRIYSSAKAIMFSRRICYFFARPKSKGIELCFFLDRPLKAEAMVKVKQYTKSKFAHTMRINHPDQVEEPLTGWLRKAWDLAS